MTVSALPYNVEFDGAEGDDPYVKLWRAVLARGIEDALGNPSAMQVHAHGTRDALVWYAAGWIGSRGFREVAELAGFDPDALLDRLKPVMAMPEKERLAWLRRNDARKGADRVAAQDEKAKAAAKRAKVVA